MQWHNTLHYTGISVLQCLGQLDCRWADKKQLRPTFGSVGLVDINVLLVFYLFAYWLTTTRYV